ncbi:MAG: hypothetical protein FJ207_12180 [Gemmatimonadetes bacterium]|nr:hypothetical protein [Gemmatimonadota bacterium]
MQRLTILTLVFAALATRASLASAQACLGLPSFAAGSVHLNATAQFLDSATVYAAGIGAGRPDNLFANLGGGRVSYAGLVQSSSFGFLEFGLQWPLGRAQLCPIAGGTFGVGPDDDVAGIKVTSWGASAGVALGLPIRLSLLTVVPSAGVRYEYLSQDVDERDVGSLSETFTSGVADLGVGFGFRDRLTIQPLTRIPFGGEDDEISLVVFTSLSVGWPAH